MATDPRASLPKRFQPLYDQAMTEAALRYGSQESGLASILGQLSRQHDRDLQAQQTANMSLLGSLKGANQQLQGFYAGSGITPDVQAKFAGTPTGLRLASEMASAQAANQQGLLGAQASNEYNTNKINQGFGEQLQQVSDQSQAEQKERGLFTQQNLATLISADQSARHDANVAAAKQSHDDLQAEYQRQTSIGNALIGQGLQPVLGADGSVTVGSPLPGGKADPSAQKKPKRTTGPGTASPASQQKAGTAFQKALSLAQSGASAPADPNKPRPTTEQKIQGIANLLTNGRPAAGGQPVYDTVPVKDPYGNVTGSKQIKRLNKDGTPVTTKKTQAIPSFDAPIAQAVAEQAVLGYVTTATVRALQKLGYSVNQIPHLTTQNQSRSTSQTGGTPEAVPGVHGHI